VPGAQITWVVDPEGDRSRSVAARFGIGGASTDLDAVLARDDVNAVVLATPTPLHARQAIAAMRAGKHVAVEIPVADSWRDAEEVLRVQQETGLVCTVGHTRRFNPPHQWIHRRVAAGELSLQHLVVQTLFLRRSNLNALGESRSWTDHLLWHHAAHTVDLFIHQTGETVRIANLLQGPPHPELGIATDMSVQLSTPTGKLCTLALSFNDDGPFGTTFRYICDKGTYLARYDDLVTGWDEPIDLGGLDASGDGIELQDRDFVAAVREGRESRTGVAAVIDCYRVLAALESMIERCA
jgi:2-hydroxy-4-carboxymuconate semialdehyde hemiacetal dehydrogenase